jgi:hypothetical protein
MSRISRHTAPDHRDPAATAGLRQRLALRAVSPLQAEIDACVAESDREVARRQAARLARLPIGERSEARPSADQGAKVVELDSLRG